MGLAAPAGARGFGGRAGPPPGLCVTSGAARVNPEREGEPLSEGGRVRCRHTQLDRGRCRGGRPRNPVRAAGGHSCRLPDAEALPRRPPAPDFRGAGKALSARSLPTLTGPAGGVRWRRRRRVVAKAPELGGAPASPPALLCLVRPGCLGDRRRGPRRRAGPRLPPPSSTFWRRGGGPGPGFRAPPSPRDPVGRGYPTRRAGCAGRGASSLRGAVSPGGGGAGVQVRPQVSGGRGTCGPAGGARLGHIWRFRRRPGNRVPAARPRPPSPA